MDRTGSINGAFRQLKIARESEKIRQEPKPLPQGPFRVGVIDPPWLYEDESYSFYRRGVVPYSVMSVEEIMAIPVPEIMHQDSVLCLDRPGGKPGVSGNCSDRKRRCRSECLR